MDSELYISFFIICSTLNDNILSHIFFNFSQISFVFKFACLCVCVCVCMWVEIEVKAICFSQFLFILRQLSRLNILNGSFFFWFLNVVFVCFSYFCHFSLLRFSTQAFFSGQYLYLNISSAFCQFLTGYIRNTCPVNFKPVLEI